MGAMQLMGKKDSVIGLDIGTGMVKAVKMTAKGKGYILDNFALEPVEEGAIQSGEIKNPTVLAQAALKAVRRCDPKIRDVVIALPNYSILSDVLTMDLRPEKEMREAVMMEAQQVSPFDMSDVELDYAILNRDEDAGKIKVLMVVAKNNIILNYLDFLGEAGLRPVVIDVDLFALTNVFQMNYDMEKYRSSILLNIGTENTIAAFIQNGVYHSSRDITVAGANFIRELGLVANLSTDMVHNIIRGVVPPEINPEPVRTALNNASREFADAVDVALSYLQSSDAIEKLDLIALSGGFAWVPGLINVLELRTGTEVIVMDPFITVQCSERVQEAADPKKIGNLLAVAIGLGTRTS
jgi:type IV pilus assembly protein PilM